MLGASILKTTGTPCSALTPHVQMEVAGLSLRDFVAADSAHPLVIALGAAHGGTRGSALRVRFEDRPSVSPNAAYLFEVPLCSRWGSLWGTCQIQKPL